ncbi:MAG: hypothetical protein U9Q08_02830, partial [Candidatus Omnitrophota bacterium]|nr:hypothetical protein [Candidatus Omnitrophota bacterium]
GIPNVDDAFPYHAGDGDDIMETRYPIRLFLLADMFLGLGLNRNLPASDYPGFPPSGEKWDDWAENVFAFEGIDGWWELPWVRDEIKEIIEEYEPPELLEDIDYIAEVMGDGYEGNDLSPNQIKDMLWQDVVGIREDTRWRAMDDVMTRIADAKMGKVMTDCHGFRVRMEQYILRPAAKTVQFLTVNLRGSSAGSLAGLTALDWRTNFNRPIENGQLRNLPWQDYLTTHNSDPYITSTHPTYTAAEGYYTIPTDMKIALTHGNTVDSIATGDLLFEFTKFGERESFEEDKYRQYIDYCMLGIGSGALDLGADWDVVESPGEGFLGIIDGLWLHRTTGAVLNENVGGGAWFIYNFPNNDPSSEPFFVQEATEFWGGIDGIMNDIHSFRLDANFYVIDNSGTLIDRDISEIVNLRDALRVGFFELPSGSNLEMSFLFCGVSEENLSEVLPCLSEELGIYQLFNAPIDIVISPAPIPTAEDGDPSWIWHEQEWGEL